MGWFANNYNNNWRINSRVTINIVINGSPYNIVFLTWFSGAETQLNRWKLRSIDRRSIALKRKMFAKGWVLYPRPRGSPVPTLHEACSASCQVGSGDPLVLGCTTQPLGNILIFKSRDGIFDCCFSVNSGRMGYNVVFWRHANTYSDVSLANCHDNVSKWVTCIFPSSSSR